MTSKGNDVLYLDKELVEKSKELGFNLSKTFENHLKQLMPQFSAGNSLNNFNLSLNNNSMVGLPVPIPKWVQNLSQKKELICVSNGWKVFSHIIGDFQPL